MNLPEFQAHRGVSVEYPENTVSSVLGAFYQGYTLVEIDPAVTKDGEIVLLHDRTINRTARYTDGSCIEKEIDISDITYNDLLQFDFGIWFSNKFKGEKTPLLSEILEIGKKYKLQIKIDNKIQSFKKSALDKVFEIVRVSQAEVGFTSNNVEFVKVILKNLPCAKIHYDGKVTAQTLKELNKLVPKERLTVWLPYNTPLNSWVRVDFATKELASLVKKYARLGIWTLTQEKEFENVVTEFAPDIIETNGSLKPVMRTGIIADMHTHSLNSHDSTCSIENMAKEQVKKGVSLFAVTDHCDIQDVDKIDVAQIIRNSVCDAETANKKISNIEILRGVEIGESYCNKGAAEDILGQNDYDVVIGSVHAVDFPCYEIPYSQIDFGAMGKEMSQKYLEKYFEDTAKLIKETQLDIFAHLTCPLRYINGKYGLNIDCRKYEDKIKHILKLIIRRGIALELNTSCKGGRYDEFMPEDWIIKLYSDLGGYLITLGSDAHAVNNASHYFSELIDLLKNLGFVNIYYFKNRYSFQCRIK